MQALLISLAILGQDPKTEVLEIRDADGGVLVSADEILGYEWAAHTLILQKGVADNLADYLIKEEKPLSAPFSLVMGGKTIYKGLLVSRFSSNIHSGIVIVLPNLPRDENVGVDRLLLELGYPKKEFFKGKDPRSDVRLKKALQQAGKLRKAEKIESAP